MPLARPEQQVGVSGTRRQIHWYNLAERY
jgi:hypothetical protein